MVRRRYFSHDSPSGSSPRDRARRTGYVRGGCSWTVGEVLARGTARRSTAASTVRAWLREPGPPLDHPLAQPTPTAGSDPAGNAGRPLLRRDGHDGRRPPELLPDWPPAQGAEDRPPRDAGVEPERPRARVLVVELELVGQREPAVELIELRETREAGSHGRRLEAQPARPGADEAEVAAHHAPELRERGGAARHHEPPPARAQSRSADRERAQDDDAPALAQPVVARDQQRSRAGREQDECEQHE